MDKTLLVQVESLPGEILRQAFEYAKQNNSKVSLQYVCNHCDIPSKGHLLDVMKGRRKIKSEYIDKTFSFLGFTKKEVDVIKLLCQLEKTKKIEERAAISKDILLARKRLNVRSTKIIGGAYNPFIFVKTLCSLGIEDLIPTAKHIAPVIGETIEETQWALDALLEQGWVTQQDEFYLYDPNACELIFPEGDQERFHLRHIELAVQDGLKKLKTDFQDTKNTYFQSTSLSLKLDQYQQFLEEFKEYLDKNCTRLESDRADGIAHFNIMVYLEKGLN